ncbi:MAG: DUF2293 domain-containing protein [Elusimicrobiota bacterium]
MEQETKELLVFSVRRKDSTCSGCDADVGGGGWVTLQDKGPLCLICSKLDHLEFLSAGDAALTRRAVRQSRTFAKVLRWSRTRKQYERQGVLVEAETLRQAKEFCEQDAAKRETKRRVEAQRCIAQDEQYKAQFALEIREMFPGCPVQAAQEIAWHACQKHSGRVGRSAAAKEFDPKVIELAVRARIRHRHTNYDLLAAGDRYEAREMVAGQVEEVFEKWRNPCPQILKDYRWMN